MRAAIRTFPAAYEVGFNYDIDECYVSYDASAPPEMKLLTKAIETRAGFKAWVHKSEWPSRETIQDPAILPR
ncbi:MAG TPA: hypothetical protein VM261_35155 [Kofleriaceae bacterium]|nr:hypothetical protein [Kofleriaceae bacterium]